MTDSELIEHIKDCLQIEIDTETNDFMSTDGRTTTRVTVLLRWNDDIISESSFTT